MPQTTPAPIKPGYKTTEFWLSTAAMLLGVVFASGVIVEGSIVAQVAGIAATVLGSLGYAVSRGAVKKAEQETF